jgi:hypothetical protein
MLARYYGPWLVLEKNDTLEVIEYRMFTPEEESGKTYSRYRKTTSISRRGDICLYPYPPYPHDRILHAVEGVATTCPNVETEPFSPCIKHQPHHPKPDPFNHQHVRDPFNHQPEQDPLNR